MTAKCRMAFCLVLIAGMAIACAVCAQPLTREASASVKVAKDANADLPLLDLAGYKQMVASHRGKALMVNFWATWCEPCRDEYPMVVELGKKYAPKGLVVVGVSLDIAPDAGLVHQFLGKAKPDFANYRWKPSIDVDAFYNGVSPDWHGTMPQTVFYARDGHIARYLVGARPESAFEDAIRLILLNSAAENQESGEPAAGN